MTKSKSKIARPLSPPELKLLKFLWRWKVAPYTVIHRLFFSDLSTWRSYKKLRILLAEGYLKEELPSIVVPTPLFSLTQKGYEVFRREHENLEQKRFKPQSVPHDYLASSFQLGEFVLESPVGVEFFTETELSSLDVSQFPAWVPPAKDHIPDGLTLIKGRDKSRIFAIEVEITLKPIARYDKMNLYFHLNKEVDQVLWLCGSGAVARTIFSKFSSSRMPYLDPHSFILIDDFRQSGWSSKVILGSQKGKTVSEIYQANLWQSHGKTSAKTRQENLIEILFPKSKSPQKHSQIQDSACA